MGTTHHKVSEQQSTHTERECAHGPVFALSLVLK